MTKINRSKRSLMQKEFGGYSFFLTESTNEITPEVTDTLMYNIGIDKKTAKRLEKAYVDCRIFNLSLEQILTMSHYKDLVDYDLPLDNIQELFDGFREVV